MRISPIFTLTAAVLACSACGGDGKPGGAPDAPAGGGLDGPVQVDVNAAPATKLSAYRFFTWDARTTAFTFNDRVVPYDMNTPLFSDDALKQRAIYIPPGAAATYDPESAFDFPVGSVIIKTFWFADDLRTPATSNPRLVETRLLVRHAAGWVPLPYIWDADQKDATFSPGGETRTIAFTDATGAPRTANYLIPARNQCETCHAHQEVVNGPIDLVLIGVKARHLNRTYDYGGTTGAVNQLDHLAALGMLHGAPAAVDAPKAYDFRPIEANGAAAVPAGELDLATRSYLDINCGHCHNPHGVNGVTSQLFLDHTNTDAFHLGVCKRPGSAGVGNGGLVYDIVPGSPDQSILYFRDSTTQVGAIMPLLERSITHQNGSALIKDWIAAMPPLVCDPP
ncbi:MAG TPA: SO2930 family diheme c-type cytochrome [Kofleriaceae bacterium]|nr:SO2930 family diheme c-type cytochrome [Kofleriaceae bacterium]